MDDIKPYTVELVREGCAGCGEGKWWGIVRPDGVMLATNYKEQSDAQDLAADLNEAFRLARATPVAQIEKWFELRLVALAKETAEQIVGRGGDEVIETEDILPALRDAQRLMLVPELPLSVISRLRSMITNEEYASALKLLDRTEVYG